MKAICCLITCIAVLSVSPGHAQEKSDDLALVKASVENYFQGYIHRDLTRLELAFDTENGTMKLPLTTEAGEEGFENGYFKEIIPKWGARDKLPQEVLDQAQLEVQRIDIVSAKMAVAVIRMEVGDKVYVDVLSLQKMNEQWKITNKMYIAL
ncbi:MAG: nuclear transport factor 2 family protein [Saprospiraceae bacterium]|nr:nuclear transport factor 2 family protein [Saprospiraceae bacterium]